MIAAAPRGTSGGYCRFLISPGLLNFCRFYKDLETGAPRRCWNQEGRFECPNNSTARHPELLDTLTVHANKRLLRGRPLIESEPELEEQEEAAS